MTYLHTQGTVGIDWRTSPGYTRRGGFLGATLHDYNDQRRRVRLPDGGVRRHRSTCRSCAKRGCSRSAAASSTRSTRTASRRRSSCCRRSAAARRCAASAAGASATRTACCCRRSGESWSTAISTWRSSTTPARSPRAGRISTSIDLKDDFGVRPALPRAVRHAAAGRARREPRKQPLLHVLVVRRFLRYATSCQSTRLDPCPRAPRSSRPRLLPSASSRPAPRRRRRGSIPTIRSRASPNRGTPRRRRPTNSRRCTS